MACELLAWMQMLAFTGPARRWEPKRLRRPIFAAAGRIVRGGRRLRPRLAKVTKDRGWAPAKFTSGGSQDESPVF